MNEIQYQNYSKAFRKNNLIHRLAVQCYSQYSPCHKYWIRSTQYNMGILRCISNYPSIAIIPKVLHLDLKALTPSTNMSMEP